MTKDKIMGIIILTVLLIVMVVFKDDLFRFRYSAQYEKNVRETIREMVREDCLK